MIAIVFSDFNLQLIFVFLLLFEGRATQALSVNSAHRSPCPRVSIIIGLATLGFANHHAVWNIGLQCWRWLVRDAVIATYTLMLS